MKLKFFHVIHTLFLLSLNFLPGPWIICRQILVAAVLLAEGPTETAKPAATKIYRQIIQGPGKKVIKKLQVELDKVIFEGDLSKNIQLKPGDIILIPRSFF